MTDFEKSLRRRLYAARAADIAARAIGGETMIMSGRDSSLFSLNETATALWNALDGVTPLGEIVLARLVEAYNVTPEEALADAEHLMTELESHGIVVLSETPILDPLPGLGGAGKGSSR